MNQNEFIESRFDEIVKEPRKHFKKMMSDLHPILKLGILVPSIIGFAKIMQLIFFLLEYIFDVQSNEFTSLFLGILALGVFVVLVFVLLYFLYQGVRSNVFGESTDKY
jgi:hypothetical protein